MGVPEHILDVQGLPKVYTRLQVYQPKSYKCVPEYIKDVQGVPEYILDVQVY